MNDFLSHQYLVVATGRHWLHLPWLYGIFVVHRFLRYLFHIRIRNSRELEKRIPQYIVAHYFKRELYIASANLTNLDLSKIVGFVPESNQVNRLILLYICSTNPQFFRWIKLSGNSREPWISRHYFIHVSKWYLRWKSSEGDANRLERYRADEASQWSVAEFG